jgi:hypothetical protein
MVNRYLFAQKREKRQERYMREKVFVRKEGGNAREKQLRPKDRIWPRDVGKFTLLSSVW